MRKPCHTMQRLHQILLIYILVLLLFLPHAESCLPSWFRQERSADPIENTGVDTTKQLAHQQQIAETNEIGEDVEDTTTTTTISPFPDESDLPTPPPLPEVTGKHAKELTDKEAEYAYEYDEEESEEENALKYNEEATNVVTSTLQPAVKKEIEKLKEAKCKDYCHHNATCHVEVIFRDDKVAAVVPSCHCPHGWEGSRCDEHYVQAFYSPVSGRYNVSTGRTRIVIPPKPETNSTNPPILANVYQFIWESGSSALPAFGFLVVMLIMFVTIVVYAYRRMAKKVDEQTYTMSHMCPPEAFAVLKTPNGRKISVRPHDTMFISSSSTDPTGRPPIRTAAIKAANESAKNNFFSILKSQGMIPSRNLNEDETPKHYKSVPRVEVSAIHYSGHIDFSTITFPMDDSHQQNRPTSPPHVTIQMEEMESEKDNDVLNFRSPSRSDGEPSSPISSQPMIPLKR